MDEPDNPCCSTSYAPESVRDVDNHSRTRFANRALFFVALGTLTIFLLDLAERQDVITKSTESLTRLIIGSTLMLLMVKSASRLSGTVQRAVRICVAFVILEMSFEVIEDLDAFNSLPLLGKDSDWCHAIEKFIVSGWTCSGIYLIYALIHQLDNSYDRLWNSEVETTAANQRLEQTLVELRESQSQIIQQERLNAIGRMASGVAHDLNNALTPLVAVSHKLQCDSTQTQSDAIELIRDGAEHAAHVVKQLQYFYRTDHDEDHVAVNLSNIVQRAIDLTRFRWSDSAWKGGEQIHINTATQSECFVSGNSTELLQLMINLLLNAIDAIETSGRIDISIRKSGDQIELVVSDNGSGMTEVELEQCFEPFFTTKSHGSGLGLSVCHGIARRHDGKISAERNPDQGTRITVRLPACEPEEIVETPVQERPIVGKKVLCIDDNDTVRRAMRLLFEESGIEFETAANGHEGLARLRASKYDLLLTDLGMKEMSGREVVANAKASHPELPVGVLSGWSRDQVLSQFNDGGPKPDFVFEKPIEVQIVKDCIARSNRS